MLNIVIHKAEFAYISRWAGRLQHVSIAGRIFFGLECSSPSFLVKRDLRFELPMTAIEQSPGCEIRVASNW